MEDDDVIFQDSVLHQHLKSVGFTDDDVHVEYQPRDGEDGLDHSNSNNCDSDRSYAAKPTFWAKLKSSMSNAFWDEAWNDQLTQVHNKHADELTDNILRSTVLEEEDGMYIESLYTSMQSYRPDAEQEESSIMGVMLMQMGILSVSLAYAGFRMVYLKSPDQTSRYYIWSIDIIAVLLTIASLTPTTVKSASAGRTVSRLKEFSKTSHKFLKEVETFYRLTKRSVKLVQEMELVVRGFTIISPLTPVTRLEQGNLQRSCRQCPKLRRVIFHTSRSLMLNIKRSAQNLLKSFPAHVEIDGVSSYLANQPLHHYGPCVYVTGEHMEDKLRAVTEDYSLASIKAMVELCNIHMSEFLRVLAMSCLTQTEEHDKNPSYKHQKQILQTLHSKLQEHIKPLTKLYTLHKSLSSAREKKEKEREQPRDPIKQSPAESVYIAIHSLSLHLQAALNRIHNVEEDLESVVFNTESTTADQDQTDLFSKLLPNLTSSLDVVKADIGACQDCVEESQIRVAKLCQHEGKQSASDPQKSPNQLSGDGTTKTKCPPIPLFDIGDPVIQDQVFEAYTDNVEVEEHSRDTDYLLSDEEREKRRKEKREAVRLLKELKNVIAIRAVEYEERERQALIRQYPDAKFEDPIAALRKQSKTSEASSPENEEDSNSGFVKVSHEQCVLENSDAEGTMDSEEYRTDYTEQTSLCSLDKYGVQSETEPTCFEGDTSSEAHSRGFPLSLISHTGDGIEPTESGNIGFPFSKQLAAQAVARSHQMAALSADTFGDDSSDEDVGGVEGFPENSTGILVDRHQETDPDPVCDQPEAPDPSPVLVNVHSDPEDDNTSAVYEQMADIEE